MYNPTNGIYIVNVPVSDSICFEFWEYANVSVNVIESTIFDVRGAIIFFDVSSFQDVKSDISKAYDLFRAKCGNIPICLIANKVDLIAGHANLDFKHADENIALYPMSIAYGFSDTERLRILEPLNFFMKKLSCDVSRRIDVPMEIEEVEHAPETHKLMSIVDDTKKISPYRKTIRKTPKKRHHIEDDFSS